MGRDLYERIPAARRVFDLAAEVLGFDIARLCFEGPSEELNRTVNAQPCLLAVELAALAAVRGAGVEAGWAAGHSLGEFSAWVASGAVAVDVALRLVRRRGELMEQAAQRNPGGMAAILGLEEDTLAEICREAGSVVLANMNCPGQIVVSGEKEAVAAAGERARAAGGRAIPLAVSGAFHSPLMAEADSAFRAEVEAVSVADARIPVVANVSAEPVRQAAEIRAAMAAQMTSPVRWEASVRRLLAEGVKEFVEVGPGDVLTGLLRRIDRNARGRAAGDPAAVAALAAEQSGGIR